MRNCKHEVDTLGVLILSLLPGSRGHLHLCPELFTDIVEGRRYYHVPPVGGIGGSHARCPGCQATTCAASNSSKSVVKQCLQVLSASLVFSFCSTDSSAPRCSVCRPVRPTAICAWNRTCRSRRSGIKVFAFRVRAASRSAAILRLKS